MALPTEFRNRSADSGTIAAFPPLISNPGLCLLRASIYDPLANAGREYIVWSTIPIDRYH
jgi:hypothetical protein